MLCPDAKNSQRKGLAESGISLGGINPFLWQRRRKWKKQYEGNPVYQIDNPLDLAALLATATAKADGDMSSDEKRTLLDLFQKEFNVDKKGAAARASEFNRRTGSINLQYTRRSLQR